MIKIDMLEGFLWDLILIIQEDYYNATLPENEEDYKGDGTFLCAENYAYYCVLDLIASQLNVLGIEYEFSDKISPILGKKATMGEKTISEYKKDRKD